MKYNTFREYILVNVLKIYEAHHRYDIGCHVREAHTTRVESAHQQLPVLISVFMFRYVICLDHLFLQNNHQLENK